MLRNRVFIDRMAGVGKFPKEEAISYGLTGPLLRAAGVSYDVRKAHPYLVYDRMEFEVPMGDRGDNYDRFNVRFQEMYQSKRIIEQARPEIFRGKLHRYPGYSGGGMIQGREILRVACG